MNSFLIITYYQCLLVVIMDIISHANTTDEEN